MGNKINITLKKKQFFSFKSEHVSSILGRGEKNWFSHNHTRSNVLVAIMTLRKICNHPDLYLSEFDENEMVSYLYFFPQQQSNISFLGFQGRNNKTSRRKIWLLQTIW